MVNTEGSCLDLNCTAIEGHLKANLRSMIVSVGECLSSEFGCDRIMSFKGLGETSDESLGRLLKSCEEHLGTSLFSDLTCIAGLEELFKRAKILEWEIREMLTRYAQHYINVVSEIPPISSHCAELLLQLNAISLEKGDVFQLYEKSLGTLSLKASQKWDVVSASPVLVFRTLEPILTMSQRASVLAVFQCLLLALSAYECVLQEVSRSFFIQCSLPPSLVRADSFLSPLRSTCSLERKEQGFSSYSIEQILRFILQGDFVDAVCSADQWLLGSVALFQDLQRKEELQDYGTEVIRNLEIENVLYLQSLWRVLARDGELFSDITKFVESVFQYSTERHVACADLIDEELLKLGPGISRETLARARLEVRLNDMSFPQSVAHKDWILGLLQQTNS